MAKFTKAFRGVMKGEIYPTQFMSGDDCPPELESAAKSLGVIGKAVSRPALGSDGAGNDKGDSSKDSAKVDVAGGGAGNDKDDGSKD